MFVIYHKNAGVFVSEEKFGHSYSNRIVCAKKFPNKLMAEKYLKDMDCLMKEYLVVLRR